MTVPLSGWNDFRVEMEPHISRAQKEEITMEEFSLIFDQKMKNLHEKYDKNKKEWIGWLGGEYDNFGFYDSKADAERGYQPAEKISELIGNKFKGEKIKMSIEIV